PRADVPRAYVRRAMCYVPRTCARGTWHVAPGTWHLARGTRHLARGTWHAAHVHVAPWHVCTRHVTVSLTPPQHDRTVLRPESEAVAQRRGGGRGPSAVGDDVDVAGGVGI